MNSSVAITSHVAMAMLGVLYVTGLAQAKTVAREDNIWDGKAHQPTRSEVLQRERLSRIAESPQRDKLADDEVESLYRELIRSAPRSR
jgi:hypothetical protein